MTAKCILTPDEVALKWPNRKLAVQASQIRKSVPFLHKIPTTNHLQFSQTPTREKWKKKCQELEEETRVKFRSCKIRNYDLSVTLPPRLYERVARIIALPPLEEEKKGVVLVTNPVVGSEGDEGRNDVGEGDEDSFNESTCSEILRKEQEHPKFELKLEQKVNRKSLNKIQSNNWYSGFICKKQRERVKWDSKIYKVEKKIWEKPLYEQAEELMDTAAERFTDWLSKLGSDKSTNMSKELLKSLFSIESGGELLAGIHIEPKQVKAVPTTVAERWNVPEMAIELKLQKSIEERKKQVPKQMHTVAFGSTLPQSMRPWIPSEFDKPIEPFCPEELLTREKLFKGIAHLRSTKALLEFYEKRPDVKRPKYLYEEGYFGQQARRVSRAEIPLYEQLNLKEN